MYARIYFRVGLQQALPAFNWLSHYQRQYLGADALAGITVGIVLVPQGLAYAQLAGLPSEYGLYASMLPRSERTVMYKIKMYIVSP